MDIKLFVCCHQLKKVPECSLLLPIQVGAALADTRFPGFLYDDTGDNISRKNRSYCELTAQYWAWKNAEADYYGFFHYRRYLYPNAAEKRPYCIRRGPTLQILNQLGYEDFAQLISGHDVIVPKGENMYVPVREHYANAPFHHREDLELAEEIVRDKYPQYTRAMERYFAGTVCYFGNIYIMKRDVFDQYCSWLFPILEEFDIRANTSRYLPQELRVDGYLAERLFGIWYEFYKRELLTMELPRVHFEDSDFLALKKRLLNFVLCPGSKHRARVKELTKR